MKKILMSLLMVSVLLVSVGFVFAAKLEKVDVCHLEGNRLYHMISVSENALPAHLAHGDERPGEGGLDEECNEVVVCEYSVVETGASYPGSYGSTVTPVTITNEDRSTVDALKSEATQSFAVGGWAGWSCVETGYLNAVGGGVTDGVASAQGLAEVGAAAIDGYDYPVYPHYTFNAAGGEEGWVVRAGDPAPTSIYVLCAA